MLLFDEMRGWTDEEMEFDYARFDPRAWSMATIFRLFLSAKVWNGSRLLLTFERFYCLLRLDVCWIINDKEEKFCGNVYSLREYRLGLMK